MDTFERARELERIDPKFIGDFAHQYFAGVKSISGPLHFDLHQILVGAHSRKLSVEPAQIGEIDMTGFREILDRRVFQKVILHVASAALKRGRCPIWPGGGFAASVAGSEK